MMEFDRIEDTRHDPKRVSFSFTTDYRGVWQCSWTDGGLKEFNYEPPFESLKKSDQEYVGRTGVLLFYMTFGRLPEHLSDASA